MGRISERKRTRKEESPRFVRKPSKGRSSGRSSGRSRDSTSRPNRRESSGRSRDSGSRFNRRDSDRDRGPRERSSKREEMQMHTVTCDQCSKKCEVPFKPTSSKPVYCSDCYRIQSKGGDRHSNGNGNIEAELKSIHKKLDRILDTLEM